MPLRAAVFATIACLVSAALAGCSHQMSTRTVVNPVPSLAPLQLTGTVLNDALLPLTDFPAGYAVDPQGSSDSGSSLVTPSPTPSPSTRDCVQLVQAATFPQSSMTGAALEILVDTTIKHPSAYHQVRVGQFVFQFPTAAAAADYIGTLSTTIAHCPTETATANGVTSTIKQEFTAAAPAAGHQVYLLSQAGTVNHVANTSKTLFAVDGPDVCVVSATVYGVPFPARPTLAALLAKLIARVQALM
jgi:hypothetical protein